MSVARRLARVAALALLCAAQGAGAQIYAGTDANATPILSNFPSAATPELIVPAPGAAPAAAIGAPAVPPRAERAGAAARIDPLVRSVAETTSLPPRLLHAVIAAESGYDARAVSREGAVGLMQLMPATARRFGVVDAFDPQQNVSGGAAYLKWLLDRFDGDLELTLAAYNAGEGAVARAGNRVPPYAETRAYVPRVLDLMRRAALY